jgi:hypothetical protein
MPEASVVRINRIFEKKFESIYFLISAGEQARTKIFIRH